jgi:hypothetical protein
VTQITQDQHITSAAQNPLWSPSCPTMSSDWINGITISVLLFCRQNMNTSYPTHNRSNFHYFFLILSHTHLRVFSSGLYYQSSPIPSVYLSAFPIGT